MTEKEKALLGIPFLRGDPELKQQRDTAESLCFRFNHTPPEEAAVRAEILKELLPYAEEGYTIKTPFVCEYGCYTRIGKHFFANCNCKIMDGGTVTFGDHVLIGPDCTFVTVAHPTDPEKRLRGYQQFKPITVGNNVWFGAGVTVCPGVCIGDNCVIGAGSVVVKEIPANSVAVGNPCRVIRKTP